MKLNDKATIRYSDRERKIFSIIVEKKKTNTLEIAKKFYGKPPPWRINGTKIVYQAVASLRDKIDRNKEPFKIGSTKRSGSIPMSFWIEKT